MVDVSEIKGVKGLYAFKALQTLLFSYFMLPEFRQPKETYTEFLKRFSAMGEKEQRETLKTALYFAGIDENEILALCLFAKDPNGVPYGKSNLANLEIEELFAIIIDVCMAIVKIKVFFNRRTAEKIKNYSIDLPAAFSDIIKSRSDFTLEEVLNKAFLDGATWQANIS